MIYVFIISHGHERELSESGLVEALAEAPGIEVLVKDNRCGIASPILRQLCRGATFITDTPGLGFGANNNFLFQWARSHRRMTQKDYIALVNPDISVRASMLPELARTMEREGCGFATIALYNDEARRERDPSAREFPSFSYWLHSRGKRLAGRPYADSELLRPVCVDWASGAFWMVSADFFEVLGGFDERYFMYFEDVDFCFRAGLAGRRIRYFPQFHAVHKGSRANRKLFSRHFFWFVTGFFRFISRKSILTHSQARGKDHHFG